jgi:ATP-binding cassette subfamily A (ABC1) protein 3
VREHLAIYASLKAVKKELRQPMVEKALRDMDLTSYADIRANNLSGGNKRKMSVAMALLGNPPLVFLDEPSTGVDPQAKRFMWNIVSKISTLGKRSAVIITTHSMEEAEALCTKMGIMVSGEFKCFGSSQHIKDKFGTGYEVEVKIRTLTETEINERLAPLGLSSLSEIPFEHCLRILETQGNVDLQQELSHDGLG